VLNSKDHQKSEGLAWTEYVSYHLVGIQEELFWKYHRLPEARRMTSWIGPPITSERIAGILREACKDNFFCILHSKGLDYTMVPWHITDDISRQCTVRVNEGTFGSFDAC
jgi:hypothetical protein